MKPQDILDLIANGENSSVEFKLDDVRPEQLAKEAVAMANLQGGLILIGVDDQGGIKGITRQNLQEWVMDTVFGRFIHPSIIPHYQEVQFPEGKRIAVLSISMGTAKPYVVRYNDREDMYVRVGSISKLATREQAIRLFGSGGFFTRKLSRSPAPLLSIWTAHALKTICSIFLANLTCRKQKHNGLSG